MHLYPFLSVLCVGLSPVYAFGSDPQLPTPKVNTTSIAAAEPDTPSDFTVQAVLSRGGPRVTVRVVSLPAWSNWYYDLHFTSTDGLDQRFEIRSGQPLTPKDVRLTDVNGDGFLDIMVGGGKDHRGEDWFKTWLYDAKGKKYRWINEAAAPTPMPAPGDGPQPQDNSLLAEKLAAAQAQNKMLWKRLAVVAIQKFLEQPAHKDLAILVAKRLDSPLDYMEVVNPSGTAQTIEHLRSFAELQHTTVPKVDPKGAVVVNLNGPKGGAWRIGVIFDRTAGTTRAVVYIPGK